MDIPPSVALTFGTFEAVLDAPANDELAAQYRILLTELDHEPEHILPQLRAIIEQFVLPESLQQRIEQACSEQGMTLPESRDALWQAIAQVWASKWTDRAYWSRQRLHIAHDDLVMAVLIQQVIEADYAFVIHTVEPSHHDTNVLYAEVVPGLGETLVGNHPGRPLGFRMDKTTKAIEWVTMPSKSVAMRGRGIIARSDSNGEDLHDFAGAGLYDSVLVESADMQRLDYVDEPLVHDRAFREQLCRSIGELGLALEQAAGHAQDVEGAVHGQRFYALQTRTQVGL